MSLNFQQIQHEFTACLRDPQRTALPHNVPPQRMQIYRDLFYNNIEGFLAQGFPLLQRILTQKELWHPLVRKFFADHACTSPYFVDIPEAFVSHLMAVCDLPSPYPPYMAELAHYEWLEMVLDISAEAVDENRIDRDGDPLHGIPVLNPVRRLAQYQWPVTTIGVGHEPSEPLPAALLLLLFRDAAFRVHFIEINALTALLLEQLATTPTLTGAEQLQALCGKMPHIDAGQIRHFGAALLEDLQARGCILGTARTS